MMKSRTALVIAISLLILGIALFIFSTRNQEPAQVFPATIKRDCAPWDGAAFTVSIPLNDGNVIDISIWKSPEIKLPVTFSFPDETMRDGNALYVLPTGMPEQLTGKVSFQRVEQASPVNGQFNLVTEAGQQFKGKFRAEWVNEIVMCG